MLIILSPDARISEPEPCGCTASSKTGTLIALLLVPVRIILVLLWLDIYKSKAFHSKGPVVSLLSRGCEVSDRPGRILTKGGLPLGRAVVALAEVLLMRMVPAVRQQRTEGRKGRRSRTGQPSRLKREHINRDGEWCPRPNP